MGGQPRGSLDVHEHLEAPRRWNYSETRKVRGGGKARRDIRTSSRVRSANENLRRTFVFHAGHVDTFLPLGRNGTRRTQPAEHLPRDSPLSPRFRNERFSQLTRDIPARYSPVLFGNLCVSFSPLMCVRRRILTISKSNDKTKDCIVNYMLSRQFFNEHSENLFAFSYRNRDFN